MDPQHPLIEPTTNIFIIAGVLLTVIVLAATVLILYCKETDRNVSYLYRQLRKELDSLYSAVDQLTSSAEQLDPDNEAALAKSLASYFAKLDRMHQSISQCEVLTRRKFWKVPANEALEKCRRSVANLQQETGELLAQVAKVTGDAGIQAQSGEESAQMKRILQTLPSSVQSNSNHISGTLKYRKPSWLHT